VAYLPRLARLRAHDHPHLTPSPAILHRVFAKGTITTLRIPSSARISWQPAAPLHLHHHHLPSRALLDLPIHLPPAKPGSVTSAHGVHRRSMSLLSDTIFTGGSTRLHVRGGHNGPKSIRKSKSHGGFLGPLVQLARNPLGTLAESTNDCHVPDLAVDAAEANRRQVLYLHMRDVRHPDWS
jgi:hypothetical protein